MADQMEEPQLRGIRSEPKGVLRANLKTLIYLGAAGLVVAGRRISSFNNKVQSKGQNTPGLLADNTDNNAETLKRLAPQPTAESQPPKQVIDPDYAPGGNSSDAFLGSHALRRCGRTTQSNLTTRAAKWSSSC